MTYFLKNVEFRKLSRLPVWAFLVLLLSFFAGTGGSATADQSEEEFTWLGAERLQRSAEALTELRDSYPLIRTYTNGRLTSRVYGSVFGNGSSPAQTASVFVSKYAPLFGVDASDLVPGRPDAPQLLTQPVMYDPATATYKFTLVYYSQVHDGVPVFESELRLLIRNANDYPLVLAVSTLRDLGSFAADKAWTGRQSDRALETVRGDEPSLTDFSAQEAVIWAGRNEDLAQPRTAMRLTASSDFPARFEYVVDPISGDILFKENLIIFEDVAGSVEGLATQGSMAEGCEPEAAEPLPHAMVVVNGQTGYTDANGEFDIANAGTDPVIVQSYIRGQYFRIYHYTGTDAVLTDTIVPPGPVDFVHNSANLVEQERAQVNAYVEANQERDLILYHNPSFPQISTTTEFPIYVNRTDGYCPGNAWYDPSDVSMNFCRSGSSYPNTAWGSVLHHEYGHHMVDAAGSGQGQYGEGFGDCMSVLLADDPDLGVGFYGNCTQALRTADNTFQYPCTSDIHTCAQLLSGAIWDTRNALLASHPSDYLDILSGLVINSVLLHTGTEITPQITIDILTLDDNDGILDNGTPHYDEICEGFDAHNLDCPTLAPMWFYYPDGRPDMLLPNVETAVRVEVQALAAAPVSGSGTFHYSLDGGSFVTGTMTEVAANVYDILLPAAGCYSRIDWYIEAETESSETVTNPADAPTSTYSVIVATATATAFADNFETNLGWTVSGNASDGHWQRGIPVGAGERGDPAEDYDGSGQCYLTDNVYGNSDIDGGTTTLTSPTFNLSAGDARISYARWYSNSFGDAPNADTMKVWISNDNGANWTLVENVGPAVQANGGWYTHTFWVSSFVAPTATMRLRYDASDLGSGSVVEAALDAVQVTTFECSSTDLTIITSSLPEWTAGVPMSQQIQTINGVGAVSFSDKYNDLDGTGLSLSSDGLVTGSPIATGNIVFTVEASDEAPITTQRVVSCYVNQAVSVNSATFPAWTDGRTYPAVQLTSTGGTGTHTWSDLNGDLVGTGLTVSASGLVGGTLTTAGNISFTVQATDEVGGTGIRPMSVTINPAVLITTESMPDAEEGEPYVFVLQASGGTGPLRWQRLAGDLLSGGLSLNSGGMVSGTATTEQIITFTAQASDSTGSAYAREFSFEIGGGCCEGVSVGNADMSPDESVTMGDLTVLIDCLFVTYEPIECYEEADVDLSGQPEPDVDDITMGDLTVLIDHLFISYSPLPACP